MASGTPAVRTPGCTAQTPLALRPGASRDISWQVDLLTYEMELRRPGLPRPLLASAAKAQQSPWQQKAFFPADRALKRAPEAVSQTISHDITFAHTSAQTHTHTHIPMHAQAHMLCTPFLSSFLPLPQHILAGRNSQVLDSNFLVSKKPRPRGERI